MNYRLIAVLAVVLVVLAGVVYLGLRGRGASNGTGGEERPYTYRINPDNIVGIGVKHLDQSVEFIRTEDGWVFDDAEKTPVDQNRFGGMQYLLAGPRADRVLEDEMGEAEKYGLTEPETITTITDRLEQKFILEFGDYNADRSLQYVHLHGSDDVFLIQSAWTDVVTRLATEPPYEAPVVIYSMEPGDINSIHVNYTGDEAGFIRTEDGWVFDDAEHTPMDPERFEYILSMLSGLSAERVLEEPGDPATYGFDDPQGTVTITSESLSFTIEIGDLSAGHTKQYVRLQEWPEVYVVDSSWAAVLAELVVDPPLLPSHQPGG